MRRLLSVGIINVRVVACRALNTETNYFHCHKIFVHWTKRRGSWHLIRAFLSTIRIKKTLALDYHFLQYFLKSLMILVLSSHWPGNLYPVTLKTVWRYYLFRRSSIHASSSWSSDFYLCYITSHSNYKIVFYGSKDCRSLFFLSLQVCIFLSIGTPLLSSP